MTRELTTAQALSFFASVIKSGEPWTETCQHIYDATLVRLVDASPSETTGGERVLEAVRAVGRSLWRGDILEVPRDVANELFNAAYGYREPVGDILARAAAQVRPIIEREARGIVPDGDVMSLRLDASAPRAGDGVPRVTEEDVAWISDLLERAKHDETQEWVVDENPMLERQQYERIAAALSYCATRQGEK